MPLCLITGHGRNMKWFKVTNLTRRFKNVCGWSFQRRVLCRKCQVRVSTTRYTGTSTHSTVAARVSGTAVAKATVTGSLPKKSARMFAYGHLTKVKMAMIYLKPYYEALPVIGKLKKNTISLPGIILSSCLCWYILTCIWFLSDLFTDREDFTVCNFFSKTTYLLICHNNKKISRRVSSPEIDRSMQGRLPALVLRLWVRTVWPIPVHRLPRQWQQLRNAREMPEAVPAW